jgi:excinuclease ABC subunit A
VKAGAAIEVVGARTHNLRNVSCAIPVGALTVVTGPSGSGKSSLAFDTVYAEGQRRFVESMSTYARQFLERMQRPDVDRIDHILPAIAIEQRAPARSARSTVGTATEIHDTLRLLYAAAGRLTCAGCGKRVRRETPATVLTDLLEAWGEGTRLLVLAPVALVDGGRQVAEWLRVGFFRALDASGAVVELAAGSAPPARDGHVFLLVARARLKTEDAELVSSLETAFSLGSGVLIARSVDGAAEQRRYLRGLACGPCGRKYEDPTPAHFSFNSPRGACSTCQGFGRLVGIDELKVIPDPTKTLDERPIAPFTTPSYESAYTDLKRACKRYGVRRDVAWKDLTAKERRIVWEGEGVWYGVVGLFAHLEKRRYKMHVRIFLARYRGYPTCPACKGARLNQYSLSVRLGGDGAGGAGGPPPPQ